ncbi:hypothetical protein [Promicromonospora sp. NPDC090134]|uniref:hypothetical protein n=1 Tax=Promicromonospora sp. NPDC090134 TaxID=3364408 RepID=UPI0037F22FF1
MLEELVDGVAAEASWNRILHVNRELIHHGAEISLLRDLYRWRDEAAPFQA